MMKQSLAIYGDSYGCTAPETFKSIKLDLGHGDQVDEFWATDRRITDNYNVTNYSIPGIDFFYCYQKFVDTHHNHDRIVFIVTNSVRLGLTYKGEYFRFSQINDVSRNLLNCEEWFPGDEEPIRIVNSVKDYFNYMVNTTLTDAGQARLIEQMQRERKDMIVVYAFCNYFIKESQINLFDISENEIKFIDDRPKFFSEHLDLRNSHLTKENNEVFASYIFDRLSGSYRPLNSYPFKTMQPEELNFYFKSIDSLHPLHPNNEK